MTMGYTNKVSLFQVWNKCFIYLINHLESLRWLSQFITRQYIVTTRVTKQFRQISCRSSSSREAGTWRTASRGSWSQENDIRTQPTAGTHPPRGIQSCYKLTSCWIDYITQQILIILQLKFKSYETLKVSLASFLRTTPQGLTFKGAGVGPRPGDGQNRGYVVSNKGVPQLPDAFYRI